MFVPGRPFKPSLIFASKGGDPLLGRLLASLANIKLDWKGMQGANNISYSDQL
jgi:hypothetical protein